jgi:hypothetical protein
LLGEIAILKQSIKSQPYKSFTTLEETVVNLDEEIFPTISQLALIHYSLPVSVASDERIFSNLKKIENLFEESDGPGKIDRSCTVKYSQEH